VRLATATIVLAIAAILAGPAAAGTPTEQRLGDATRSRVVCSPEPGASFVLVAGVPVNAIYGAYCQGIAADLARPAGARLIDATVIQGWALVGRQTAITRCYLRTGLINVCRNDGQTLAYATADEFVPGAMRRYGVTGPYIAAVTAAVRDFIEATT
jgi:hypothetical protein